MGASLPVTRRALSVGDFHRMGEMGLFRPDERIELIGGELITIAPIGGPHLRAVNVLSNLLSHALGRAAVVSTQNPIALPPDNEPQPDIAVLSADFWSRNSVPTAADVLLIVEVADTSLDYDRDHKVPLYAKHGIPEVWLINLQSQCIECFLQPAGQTYQVARELRAGDVLRPSRAPGVTIAASEILDPRG